MHFPASYGGLQYKIRATSVTSSPTDRNFGTKLDEVLHQKLDRENSRKC